MLSPYNLQKKLEIYGIIILICSAVGYGALKTYPLFVGPTVSIYNPHDGDTVASTTFEISGKVSRVKEITVQGRAIPIGTDGHFTEILLAQYPYTILVVTATDFYGKTITKTLRVKPEK